MKKILIIDNFDSFTFNLTDYFQQLGCEVKVYRNTINSDFIDKIQPDAIVFSPGPSVPKNAGNMMKIIESYYKKLPMLGVCLGHQAFIEFFGGSLKFVTPVHGEASLIKHDGKTIFKEIPQNFTAGRYHSLAAKKMPQCLEVSAICGDIVMAVRHKTLPIEGVQFHPESVLTMKGGYGLKIIKNFLEVYVKKKAQKSPINGIKKFLEKTINGQLSIKEQENFLKNHNEISADELKEAVLFLQSKMPQAPWLKDAIDVCGTGGSGLSRINTSTISAFILASLGVKVAKHGNKAASGRFGSFDLLEALNINFDLEIKDIETIYGIRNLAFLFARKFHPVMKHFAAVRQQLGKPTFFNILGPLLSPVFAKKQIIGVSSKSNMEIVAETCLLLKKEHVYVVFGEDGLDEVTLNGKTFVCELVNGKIKKYTIEPKDFGISPARGEEIAGGSGEVNTEIALKILKNKCTSRHHDLVLVNAALALKLTGKAKTLRCGYQMAKEALENGLAYESLEGVKKLSQSPGILLQIISNKKREIEKRKQIAPLKFTETIKCPKRDFLKSIIGQEKAVIAEIKKKSPAMGRLSKNGFHVGRQAEIYETAGAAAISVVCDRKFFGGALYNLEKAKDATKNTPILCKDFIIDEYQIYEAEKHGADAVLLIASILTERQIGEFYAVAQKLGVAVVCEVHNMEELQKTLRTPVQIIGINNRDLRTFKIDTEMSGKLIRYIPQNKIIIAESGILSREDIDKLPARVNAVLAGSVLMSAKNPAEKIKELTI